MATNMNAKDYAYEKIKEDILKLNLLPGTKISEKSMSELLEISRTPVREAFLKLAQEELLTIIPQSGTFVSLINMELAEEARYVRQVLETDIVGQCCETLTDEILFRLEMNIKMQEMLANNEIGRKETEHFLELDEAFHRELFVCCGKERIWKMIQNMAGHLNRYRTLRIKDIEKLDWDVLIHHHKEIYQAIRDRDRQRAESLMSNHLTLMLVEKDILIKQFPEYFQMRAKRG